MIKKLVCVLGALVISFTLAAKSSTDKITVCAAENFYGNLAKTIGGKYVDVFSIISNPNADPHLFSTSPKIVVKVTNAQVVIYNGANYDPWMEKLLNIQGNNNKLAVINVAELMGVKNGDNPHIWYKPNTFPKLASLLTAKLAAIQPEHKLYFEGNLKKFESEYNKVYELINKIKQKYQGTPVTATEPVFGYMADALGFDVKGLDLQWVVMNDSTPPPQMQIKYIKLLTGKEVKLLFYNKQVTDAMTKNFLDKAKANSIQVIGVTETMPMNKTIIQWLISELTEVQAALEKSK